MKKKHDDEIIISIDDDLKRYLQFLELMKIVRNKEEAVLGSLKIFKKLNMHDWLPYIYRHGTERLIIITQSMVNDLFNSISDIRLYDTARTSALKKKALNRYF